ncbi:hypothetical protein DAMDJJ_14755 [Cupriavidus necator]
MYKKYIGIALDALGQSCNLGRQPDVVLIGEENDIGPQRPNGLFEILGDSQSLSIANERYANVERIFYGSSPSFKFFPSAISG